MATTVYGGGGLGAGGEVDTGNTIVIPAGSAASPSLAFIGDGGEDTGWYESSTDLVGFSAGGVAKWFIGSDNFSSGAGGSGGGGRLIVTGGTATNPTVSFGSDTNSGFHSIADILYMITGGATAGQWEDPADLAATETSLWLYDKDADTVTQVKSGANGSGSIASHRMLQVADA